MNRRGFFSRLIGACAAAIAVPKIAQATKHPSWRVPEFVEPLAHKPILDEVHEHIGVWTHWTMPSGTGTLSVTTNATHANSKAFVFYGDVR